MAAGNVFELPLGKVSVDGNFCQLLVPDILTISMIPNYGHVEAGSVFDWATVERIKVVRINDVA
ncbi:hypothetical protein CHH27_02425 [Labrenzia sp. VG12]|nr:hypothetical protein CHH27_02425 [Labrenzia sp. VG12]